MPEKHLWESIPPRVFHYKPQDYTYSCFSTCLQIALVNFGLLPAEGRTIEDEFNEFTGRTLDTEAPTLEKADQYIQNKGDYFAREGVEAEKIDQIMESTSNRIVEDMKAYDKYAIIGAIKDAGHALSLIKIGTLFYGVNPNLPTKNVLTFKSNPLQSVASTDGRDIALQIPDLGAMQYCYLFKYNDPFEETEEIHCPCCTIA